MDRLPTGQQAPEFYDVPRAEDDPQGFIRAVLMNLWNARLVNMVRGGSSNTSQRLMRWRVGLQFVAILVVMIVLYFRGY